MEENDKKTNKYQKPKKKNNTVLLVLAWIFFLPFTATYFIAKSKKLDVPQKIVIIVAMWVILFIIGSTEEKNEAILKKEMITKCYSQETYDKLDELIGMSNIRITVSEDKKCDDLEIKDSSYEPIKINMNEEKELVSIAVKDKTIYGEAPKPTVKEKEVNKREPKITEKKNTNQQNKNKKSTKKETDNNEGKKESNENTSPEKEKDDIGWTEEDWNHYWEIIRNSDN